MTILDETELPFWGGERIDLWVDATGDGSMQPEEVFHSVTIPILGIRADVACAEGEMGWQVGLDLNLDGVLQINEIQTDRCSPGYVEIDAGEFFTCGLVSDRTVRCWGYNNNGQLGDGTTTASSTPVTVSGLNGAVALTVGGYHSCALLTDGTAGCWGYNQSGQLGDGTTTSSPTSVIVSGLSGIASISAGGYHTCAVLTDGTASCWGYNGYGELGDGTTTDSPTPIAVPGLSGVASISAGAAPCPVSVQWPRSPLDRPFIPARP